MENSKKLILIGAGGLAFFNPLSINLIADASIVAINYLTENLVVISEYTMAVSATLLLVGAFLIYDAKKKSELTKLKKLKHKKTEKAGSFL